MKYYAWENVVENRVGAIRKEEKKLLFKGLNVRSIVIILFETTPILISLLVFTIYTLMDNPLTPQTAFTVMSLFNLMTV
jgi:hypothetical protein